MNFKNPEDILVFRERFDGYVFVDSDKGQEYPAMVEFAPYQKVPRKSGKKDAKCGTIEEDPEYVKFLEHLEEAKAGTFSLDQQLAEIDNKEKERKAAEKATPLLEFLKEKKAEKARIRDEKREARRKKDDEKRRQMDIKTSLTLVGFLKTRHA